MVERKPTADEVRKSKFCFACLKKDRDAVIREMEDPELRDLDWSVPNINYSNNAITFRQKLCFWLAHQLIRRKSDSDGETMRWLFFNFDAPPNIYIKNLLCSALFGKQYNLFDVLVEFADDIDDGSIAILALRADTRIMNILHSRNKLTRNIARKLYIETSKEAHPISNEELESSKIGIRDIQIVNAEVADWLFNSSTYKTAIKQKRLAESLPMNRSVISSY